MMTCLKQTREDSLILRLDKSRVIKWYIDAAFAIHKDYKSHTGAVMTRGHGSVHAISKQQRSWHEAAWKLS